MLCLLFDWESRCYHDSCFCGWGLSQESREDVDLERDLTSARDFEKFITFTHSLDHGLIMTKRCIT